MLALNNGASSASLRSCEESVEVNNGTIEYGTPDGAVMDPILVRVNGRGWNIDFTLDDKVDCAVLLDSLRRHLADSSGWFKGFPVTVNVGARATNLHDLRMIREVIEGEHHIPISRFDLGDAESLEAALSEEVGVPVNLGLAEHLDAPHNASLLAPNGGDGKIHAGAAAEKRVKPEPLVIKSTCRSGLAVSHDGDLITLGDVNPGAEIAAAGDIVVVGALRGIAHAGRNDVGASSSVIIAAAMEPLQLRIGNHVRTEEPKKKKSRSRTKMPEIAYVNGTSSIVVEPFTSWRKRTGEVEGR